MESTQFTEKFKRNRLGMGYVMRRDDDTQVKKIVMVMDVDGW